MIYLNTFHQDESGAVTFWSLFWVMAFLMIGGIAVDLSNVLRSQTHLKLAADAAALGAAVDLPNQSVALATAQAYIERNAPSGRYGAVLDSGNVVFGDYNHETNVFTTGASSPNAIQVRLDRNDALNKAVPTYLLRMAGFGQFDIGAISTAVSYPYEDRCPNGGLFSNDTTSIGSHNHVSSDFCVYGANGVGVGSHNSFSDGAMIRMQNTDNFSQGNHNVGTDNSLTEGKSAVILPGGIDQLIDDIQDYTATLPHFITNGIDTVNKLPKNPVPGTFYVVRQNVNLSSGAELRNIGILALKKFNMASGAVLDNAMIVSAGKIGFGSGAEIGDAGYCSDGHFNVYLMAKGNISFGAKALVQGAQIVTQGNVSFSAQTAGVSGIVAEASGKISMGSQNTLAGCDTGHGLRSEVFAPPPKFALVR